MYIAVIRRSVKWYNDFYAIVLNENGDKLYTDNDETYINLDGRFDCWKEKYALPKRAIFRIVKNMPEYYAHEVNLSIKSNEKVKHWFDGREKYFFKITKK